MTSFFEIGCKRDACFGRLFIGKPSFLRSLGASDRCIRREIQVCEYGETTHLRQRERQGHQCATYQEFHGETSSRRALLRLTDIGIVVIAAGDAKPAAAQSVTAISTISAIAATK